MARYSIDGQVLTDIGDAIRGKVGETKTVVGNWDFDIVKDNLDVNGNYTEDGCFGKYNIPGAKRIVISNIEHTASNTTGGYVSISSNPEHYYAGLLYYSLNPAPGVQLYSGSRCPEEIILEDTEYFAYLVKSNIASGLFTFSAHVVAYDENGEILATREYETKNTFTPDQMADLISDMATVPDEVLHITGYCYSKFANSSMDWLMNLYGDRITTENITSAASMFYYTDVKRIPFEINFVSNQALTMENMFAYAEYLEEIPKIGGKPKPSTMNGMFQNCNRLRYLPEDIADWFDWSGIDTATGAYSGGKRGSQTFQNCWSLRSIPMDFLAHINPYPSGYSGWYYGLFYNCYSLDEIVGLPIPRASDMNWTSNCFLNTFDNCGRLKNMTFAKNEDGSPIQVKWSNQVIDLSKNVGATTSTIYITGYNSGITEDKRVKDDATYQALKNDPDWFTANGAYSRYNHDSAVATINSLPDTTSSGGTNTIKFNSASGSLTDGGAIYTLTEEEIAVATAKGWTVSLV